MGNKKYSVIGKIISYVFIILFALQASVGVVYAEENESVRNAIVKEEVNEIKGHKKIAENDTHQLYLKEETLSIIVRDKNTGAIMESTVEKEDETINETWKNFVRSGIGFEILENLNTKTSDLISAKAEIDTTITDNGFEAQINLTQYSIKMKLKVALTEKGLEVEIPNDSIVEENDQMHLGSIYVYPFLGYTTLGERDGYMFVPDGNGALIYLNDKEGRFASPLTQKIYGDNLGFTETEVLSLFFDEYKTVNDSEYALAPVYGMVHTDTKMGYLGIIEEGDYDVFVVAYPNGAITNYNWITTKFIMRRIYTQPTSLSADTAVTLKEKKRAQYDIKVKYAFVSEDEANYIGLAHQYRDYLIEKEGLQQKGEQFKIRLDFLGTERENWLFFKRAVVMTTTDDIIDIYNELEQEGVTDILSVYKGWQKGGINSVPITSYKADRKIGGNSGVNDLLQVAEEKSISFYLYQDGLRANPDTVNTTFNVIKKMDERQYKEETYKEVYDYFAYLTPAQSIKNITLSIEDYKDSGVNKLALAGISNHLFSYIYGQKEYTRLDTTKDYEGLISNISESMDVALEEPFAYFWKYTDAILDMPVATSDYIFTDKEVPFLSTALKGLIPMYADYSNFEANRKEYLLKLVETGIYPSYYLTKEDSSKLIYTNSSDIYTSRYDVYKEQIVEVYKELQDFHKKIDGAIIKTHEQLDNGLIQIVYSNDVTVLINYEDEAITYKGVTVDAKSYKVGE